MLPTDNESRKALPYWTFLTGYFLKAWMAVANVAFEGNRQHNPGEPLHWAREKSSDQLNTAFRHQLDYAMGVKKDTDGQWHLAKAIWRLSAQLQLDIEADEQKPAVPAFLGGAQDAPTLPHSATLCQNQPPSGPKLIFKLDSAEQQPANGHDLCYDTYRRSN